MGFTDSCLVSGKYQCAELHTIQKRAGMCARTRSHMHENMSPNHHRLHDGLLIILVILMAISIEAEGDIVEQPPLPLQRIVPNAHLIS